MGLGKVRYCSWKMDELSSTSFMGPVWGAIGFLTGVLGKKSQSMWAALMPMLSRLAAWEGSRKEASFCF